VKVPLYSLLINHIMRFISGRKHKFGKGSSFSGEEKRCEILNSKIPIMWRHESFDPKGECEWITPVSNYYAFSNFLHNLLWRQICGFMRSWFYKRNLKELQNSWSLALATIDNCYLSSLLSVLGCPHSWTISPGIRLPTNVSKTITSGSY
jgi:hypothetical protein